MKLEFPSPEFNDAVAAVCHGEISDEQIRGLNELLRTSAAARDDYILRLELHSRLASNPDLFVSMSHEVAEVFPVGCGFPDRDKVLSLNPRRRPRRRKLVWALALAACFAVLAAGILELNLRRPVAQKETTSKAIAMLNMAVNARWSEPGEKPRLGAPLDPGRLRLESGVAQIVFYSGARIAVEGPAELELISQTEASCTAGRLTAEVPPQARGFHIRTGQINVAGLGTSIGLEAKDDYTELHVFKGSAEFQSAPNATGQLLREGSGAVVQAARPLRLITANAAAFASLFNLQTRSLAVEAQCYDQWRAASSRLNRDPSLLVHFDFENAAPSDWSLHNSISRGNGVSDATIVGCEWISGRWPNKRGLEFQGVSDRVRLNVPGEFHALTLTAWVRVQGLDRRYNSLFMCDGFEPGEIHWMIQNDGILYLSVKGPGTGNFQALVSPPAVTLDQLGLWVQVAVVLDGNNKRATHYVNGQVVSQNRLRLEGPFRIGAAELGNWNPGAYSNFDKEILIRNFSGAMDEFCLFSRALSEAEMYDLYFKGRPDHGY